jgi:hypothetical protein
LDETSTDLINLSDDGGLEAHRGGLAKLDAGAKARLAKRTKDYALQQKTLKEERSKHPSLRAEKLEQRVLEKLGAPRLVEKPREYAVHFDLRAPDDARSAAGCGIDQCINPIVAVRLPPLLNRDLHAIDATPARQRGGALL